MGYSVEDLVAAEHVWFAEGKVNRYSKRLVRGVLEGGLCDIGGQAYGKDRIRYHSEILRVCGRDVRWVSRSDRYARRLLCRVLDEVFLAIYQTMVLADSIILIRRWVPSCREKVLSTPGRPSESMRILPTTIRDDSCQRRKVRVPVLM